MSKPPSRIVFVRPDTYGDLVLFEPVLRAVREQWPRTRIGVVIRRSYADLAPLLAAGGVDWLPTDCNPYARGPREDAEPLAALVAAVREFDPEWLVAPCFDPTWLEMAVAAAFPRARQIRLGEHEPDELTKAVIEAEGAVDWSALYPEKVRVDPGMLEWQKNLHLAAALIGKEVGDVWPRLGVPESAAAHAREVISAAGLEHGKFALCAPAGTANVEIKSWPAERYGAVVAWLESECGVRSLLVGHESEAATLDAVRQNARAAGGDPQLWLGRNGEMPWVAALAQAARFYFGNDTGTLHVAAAVEKPVVAIFGGGHWPRFKPAARRAAVVVQPLPCFGCGWNCIFGYGPCVREIPEEPVREALRWLLSSDAAAEREFAVKEVISTAGARLVAGAASARDGGNDAGATKGTGAASLLQQLRRSEEDRAARQRVIEEQGNEIARLNAEVERWLKESSDLWPRLNAARNERNLLAAQLQDLRTQFESSEADRAARLRVIEEQGREIARLHAEVDRWLTEAGKLGPRLEAAEHARNLLAAQLEARLRLIEQQRAEIEQQSQQAQELSAKLHRLEQHWTSRLAVALRLRHT